MKRITRRSVIKSKTILAIESGVAHNIVCNCETEVSEDARRFSVDAGYHNYGQLADGLAEFGLADGTVPGLLNALAPCAREAMELA